MKIQNKALKTKMWQNEPKETSVIMKNKTKEMQTETKKNRPNLQSKTRKHRAASSLESKTID